MARRLCGVNHVLVLHLLSSSYNEYSHTPLIFFDYRFLFKRKHKFMQLRCLSIAGSSCYSKKIPITSSSLLAALPRAQLNTPYGRVMTSSPCRSNKNARKDEETASHRKSFFFFLLLLLLLFLALRPLTERTSTKFAILENKGKVGISFNTASFNLFCLQATFVCLCRF